MLRNGSILFVVLWEAICCSGEMKAQAGAGMPRLDPSNISVFDVDAGLPISCTFEGLFDPAGRFWINPCYNQEEHRTVNFYRFDGIQSTFIEWENFPDSLKGQAVLSGFTKTGELFGFFRGTGTSFFFDPDTRRGHFLRLDTAGAMINFMGFNGVHGLLMHALSPTNHLVYRIDRGQLQFGPLQSGSPDRG